MNIVVLQGTVREEPLAQTLPSGQEALSFDLVVHEPNDAAASGVTAGRVPVVVFDSRLEVAVGDELVVVGAVRKRFFRAASTTRSRTEVIACRVVPSRRRAQVQRAIETAIDCIALAAK
jgi:hypothetical protein